MQEGGRAVHATGVIPAAVLAIALSAAAHGQCTYDVELIVGPTCPLFGPSSTGGMALNDAGIVVGAYLDCDLVDDLPFLWLSVGGLSTPQLPSTGRIHDINNDAMMAGAMGPGSRGFVLAGGALTELLPGTGGDHCEPVAVNDFGQVVGQRSVNAKRGARNAFVWSAADGYLDLGLMGTAETAAEDINDAGQVAGWRGQSIYTREAFFLSDGTLTFLGPVPGGQASLALALNNAGLVVGSGSVEDRATGTVLATPWVWEDGVMTPLPKPLGFDHGTALGINDAGQIVGVGTVHEPYTMTVPCLWQHGVVHDVNDLIDAPWVYRISSVRAINGAGQIIGSGTTVDDFGTTVVLTPRDPPFGDVDMDCRVGVTDLEAVFDEWGEDGGSYADTNDDGVVNVDDMINVMLNWS